VYKKHPNCAHTTGSESQIKAMEFTILWSQGRLTKTIKKGGGGGKWETSELHKRWPETKWVGVFFDRGTFPDARLKRYPPRWKKRGTASSAKDERGLSRFGGQSQDWTKISSLVGGGGGGGGLQARETHRKEHLRTRTRAVLSKKKVSNGFVGILCKWL